MESQYWEKPQSTPAITFSFPISPDHPLVLMARIGRFDDVRLRLDFQHRRRDLAQRRIGHVRRVHAAPAVVIAHTILRDASERMIQNFAALVNCALAGLL